MVTRAFVSWSHAPCCRLPGHPPHSPAGIPGSAAGPRRHGQKEPGGEPPQSLWLAHPVDRDSGKPKPEEQLCERSFRPLIPTSPQGGPRTQGCALDLPAAVLTCSGLTRCLGGGHSLANSCSSGWRWSGPPARQRPGCLGGQDTAAPLFPGMRRPEVRGTTAGWRLGHSWATTEHRTSLMSSEPEELCRNRIGGREWPRP